MRLRWLHIRPSYEQHEMPHDRHVARPTVHQGATSIQQSPPQNQYPRAIDDALIADKTLRIPPQVETCRGAHARSLAIVTWGKSSLSPIAKNLPPIKMKTQTQELRDHNDQKNAFMHWENDKELHEKIRERVWLSRFRTVPI